MRKIFGRSLKKGRKVIGEEDEYQVREGYYGDHWDPQNSLIGAKNASFWSNSKKYLPSCWYGFKRILPLESGETGEIGIR